MCDKFGAETRLNRALKRYCIFTEDAVALVATRAEAAQPQGQAAGTRRKMRQSAINPLQGISPRAEERRAADERLQRAQPRAAP